MAGPAHRRHYLQMPSPLHIRTYHELTEADRSGLGEQVGAQHRRVAERLAPGHRIVAVMSGRSEEHTAELQSLAYLVCRLLLAKKKRHARRRARGDPRCH